jgi:Inner membrane component of T3SS, cytoplasmic domain
MIWVEILSRYHDVAARFRIHGEEAHIGRGYDNDVIIDDPYVAVRHVRVFRDEAGRLVAEDAGSKNGLFLDRGGIRHARIMLDAEHPVRIGQTYVRIRDPAYAVPAERLAGVQGRSWLAVIAAGLAMLLLGSETLFVWLAQTAEPKASNYLTPLLIILVSALAWVSIWALLSRVLSGQARFVQNLIIALSGLVVLAFSRESARIFAFAFTWPAAVNYEYAAQWSIAAVVCFFHLRETGRSRLVLKGAAMATLLVLAVAVQTVLRSETLSEVGQQYTGQLMPPVFRLAPARDEDGFFTEIERLKAGLDRDRTKPPAQ